MTIKKYIEIPEEILVSLAEGNFVKGSLHRDKNTGRIVFNAYYLKPCKRKKDKLLASLEHGWLKESPTCIKSSHHLRYGSRDESCNSSFGGQRDCG